MKSKILAASVALAGLMTLASTAQAQSIDVSVIGTIMPASCTPDIAGGGVIDYGDIPASSLNATAFNPLASKDVAFTINCDAPAQVGITAVDNRAASKVPGVGSVLPTPAGDIGVFGLGTVSGANVGGYTLHLQQGTFTVDGAATASIRSDNGGSFWILADWIMPVNSPDTVTSWGTAAGGPVAGEVFAGTLHVQTALNKASDLPLTDEVPLDGSATLTLVYL